MSDVPLSLQSWVSAIQSVLTDDRFNFFTLKMKSPQKTQNKMHGVGH